MDEIKVTLKKSIFISYCQKDLLQVEQFEEDLKPANLNLIRDNRDVKPMESIKEFMKLVKSTDFVILFLSDNYFKSSFCMKEVMDLFSSRNFKKRMILILIDETRIDVASMQIEYTKYWEHEITKLDIETRTLKSLANIGPIQSKINHYTKVRGEVNRFFEVMSDFKIGKLKDWQKQSYKPLFDLLGIDDSGLLKQIIHSQSLRGDMREIAISELLRKFPNHENVLFLKAYFEAEKGNHKVAKFYYKEVIKMNALNEGANLNLAISLIQLKDFKDAMKCIDLVLNLNSDNLNANFFKAELNQPKNNDIAIKYYKKVIELSPDMFDAHYNLGKLLFQWKKQNVQALESFETAYKINPQNIENIVAIARCYEVQKKNDLTYKWLYKAWELDKADRQLLARLNKLYPNTSYYQTSTIKVNDAITLTETLREVEREYWQYLYPFHLPCEFEIEGFDINEYKYSENFRALNENLFYYHCCLKVKEGDFLRVGDLICELNTEGESKKIVSNFNGYVGEVLVNNYGIKKKGDPLFLISNSPTISSANQLMQLNIITSNNFNHIINSPFIGKGYRSSKVLGHLGSSLDDNWINAERYDGDYSYGWSYIHIGDEVKVGQVVCCIACMGLVNEIESEHEGFVEAILFKDGDFIEYEQPLFLLSKSKIEINQMRFLEELNSENLVVIRSPMIGKFYRSYKIDGGIYTTYHEKFDGNFSIGPPFVKQGDFVKRGTVLCAIAQSGYLDEIESEYEGYISEILVDDASYIEYDQPLFILKLK